MRRVFFILLGGVLLMRSTVLSQEPAPEKPPFPKGAMPAGLPQFAKWTVTVTSTVDGSSKSSGKAANSSRDKDDTPAPCEVITVTKTQAIRQMTIKNDRGKSLSGASVHLKCTLHRTSLDRSSLPRRVKGF